MSTLSDWIKERRKILNLTQAQVAVKLGIHQAQVSVLENGKFMPDSAMMNKIDAIFGKFAGVYVPPEITSESKNLMSTKAREGLKAYREAKENNFCLQIEQNVYITADRNQYILKQGANASYFVELKALIKYLIVSQVRQSAVNSVQEISNKLDEIYKQIEDKFANYNPANVTDLFIDEEEIKNES